jgi:hypothetical protein
MNDIFYPKDYVKKVLPGQLLAKDILNNELEIKKTILRFLVRAKAINGREIKSSIHKAAEQYKREYLQSLTLETAANGEALLKQRIENAIVYNEMQELKEEHDGELYEWLPSGGEKPDLQHQLLYGRVFKVGTGDKDGRMPDERYGCKCGCRFLGNPDKNKILKIINPEFINETVRMFNNASSKKDLQEVLPFGKVDDMHAIDLKNKTSLDLKGYVYRHKTEGIRHGIKSHGNYFKENPRGQIAVKASDFALTPEIVDKYDNVYLSPQKAYNGSDIIIYEKVIGNKYIYLALVGEKKTKTLTTYGMRIINIKK